MADWALITGASSGIGLELAKLFAARGFNLALVARNEARLNELAADLLATNTIQARVLPCDLASASAPDRIFDWLRDTPVSILANNAGFGAHGPFSGIDLDVQTDLMEVNMTALVRLTHLFLQPMLARRHGRILNVASTAAFQPGPMVDVYYASKAFVFSFSYALAVELKDSGVTVTTLCPGSTRTAFFDRAGMRAARKLPMMDARAVAEAGYRGLMQGRRVVIPGASNKLTSLLAKWSPVRLAAAVVAAINEPD